MAKHNTKGGLGRGFGALLGESLLEDAQDMQGISTLPMALIEPNAAQPRKQFTPEEMQELTASIARHGVITPITVRKIEGGYYQIIAGERRWRACRQVGITEIPAMVMDVTDAQVMEMALVENLQRADLNPIEEADGFAQLMQTYSLTQEQVAERVGRSRPAVANALRLLQLEEPLRQMVQNHALTAGHARAALMIRDPERRALEIEKLAQMSVRQAEIYAKSCNQSTEKEEKPKVAKPFVADHVDAARAQLESTWGRKISIAQGAKKGNLSLEFYGEDDLERLLTALEKINV